MEDILIIIVQFLLEFIFNVLINLPFDWPSSRRTEPETSELRAACLILFCVGCGIARLSLFIFKYSLISVAALRIANLLLSPVAAGYMARWIADSAAEINPYILPRNHFWMAFWFTVGFASVRFAFGLRI